MDLQKEQKKILLDLARKALEHYFKTGKTLKANIEDRTLREKRGAFVTLKTNQKLRGCIGYPLPYKALYETIIDAAVQAATQDYRFPSLTEEELLDTKIEISILSLPENVKDINELKIGKHGIIISKGYHKGLLLPQVPVEWNWDLETYLRHGCLKAGLDEDEWEKGAQIQKFTAAVFSE
jgi:AmmeMemoRadiSam system protein A